MEKFAGDSMIVAFVPTPEEAEGMCRMGAVVCLGFLNQSTIAALQPV